jgi:branched-chain amino acid transport system ATP-binding protein
VERRLSLTPEGRQVFGSLTCLENLRVGAGINGQSQFADRRDQVLELFPVLRDKLDVFAGLLSGGEQQQLAIARSLMSDPEVLLLDEPSLGLAPLIVERVFELIVTLRDRGMSLMIAEQNVDKALQIADRAYVLSTGRVELEGTASKLLERTEIEEAYLGLGVREEDA